MAKLKLYKRKEIDKLLTRGNLTPDELGVAYLSLFIPFINGHAIEGGSDTPLNKIQKLVNQEDKSFFTIFNEYQILGAYLFKIKRMMLTHYDLYRIGRNNGELILRTAVNVLEDKKALSKTKTQEAEKIAQFARAFQFSTRFLIAWNCFIDIVTSVFRLFEDNSIEELRIVKIKKNDVCEINNLAKIRPVTPEGASEREQHPYIKANMFIDLLTSDRLALPPKSQTDRFKKQFKKVVWSKNIDTDFNAYRYNESLLWISFYSDEEWKQWVIQKKR